MWLVRGSFTLVVYSHRGQASLVGPALLWVERFCATEEEMVWAKQVEDRVAVPPAWLADHPGGGADLLEVGVPLELHLLEA